MRTESYTQQAHGLSRGEFITAAAGGWAKARADSDSTLSLGLVTKAPNSQQFTAVHQGPADLRAHGYGPGGTVIFLSQATPGAGTTAEPQSGIKQAVAIVMDADTLFVLGGGTAQGV